MRLFGSFDRDPLFALRGAFGEKHNAFKEVHSAIELRIAGMSNSLTIFLLQALKTAGSAFEHNVALFLGSCGNGDIRRDPFLMDHFMAGRVILSSGEAQSRTIGQRKDALYRALTEGLFADNDGSLHILKAAGDNFRGACTIDIHEENHGHTAQFITMAHGIAPGGLGGIAAFSGDNQLATREKFFANVNSLFEQSTGIPTQVQNQSLHTLVFKFFQSGLEVIAGLFTECHELDVADL